MDKELFPPELCTGCGSCKQICPKSAITMIPDKYGFVFPHIDSGLCIHCGLCRKACPLLMPADLSDTGEPLFFALRLKSKEELAKSTSGGAFFAIAKALDCADLFVCGAKMNNALQVVHEVVDGASNISAFRGSKYVQSDTKMVFREIKGLLENGKKVLFAGTPCQVAGLRAFLFHKDYDGLYLCDLVCEGVQSQEVFNRFIKFLENKERSTVVSVSFRDKKRFGWERSSFIASFSNGKKVENISQTADVPYMNSFLFRGGCRDSCYSCPFARIPRQGDFSIGDLWGWRKIVPEWNDNLGISLLACNSLKAKKIISLLERESLMKPMSQAEALGSNSNLAKPVPAPLCRKDYLADLSSQSYAVIQKKWLKPRSHLRRFASQISFRVNLRLARWKARKKKR